MEIKKVNETNTNYPKKISNKIIEKNIPAKWIKKGLYSLGIAVLIKYNVYAVDSLDTQLAGDVVTTDPGPIPPIIEDPLPLRICNTACPIIQAISATIFFITGLCLLIPKIISKNKKIKPKNNKVLTIVLSILCILSLIAFLSSIFVNILIHYYY